MRKIKINGAEKEIFGLTIGNELYDIANITGDKLFLDIENEVDIPINKNEYIILSGGEKFVSSKSNLENNPTLRNKISIQVNGKTIELCQPKIKGGDICKYDTDILMAVDLYADIPNTPDQHIENDCLLIVKNGDCFITAPVQCNEIKIIVNGSAKTVEVNKLTFKQIAGLAFDNTNVGNNTIYTITYSSNGKDCPEGVLVDGEIIEINSGAIFNVTATDKS